MKVFLFTLIICTAFYACSTHKNEQKGKGTVTCEWNVNADKVISSFIDTITYVALDSDSNGLFKTIDKLMVQDNKYFVFDCFGRNQVLVFDSTGKFLFPVGHKGKGPGEYIRIRNFTVDSKNIYLINNDLNLLLTYDLSGNFVKQQKLPFIAFDMAAFDNGDLIFSWHQNQGGNDNRKLVKIVITDNNLYIKQQLLPINDDDGNILSKRYYLTSTDDLIIFHNLFSNSVYTFNKQKSEIASIYKIDFKDKEIPDDKKKSHLDNDGYDYLITTPFIIPGYIIGSLMTNDNKSNIYLYNIKKTRDMLQPSNRSSIIFVFTTSI